MSPARNTWSMRMKGKPDGKVAVGARTPPTWPSRITDDSIR